MAQPFRHELRVRYGEVDMQGHVFNAHYLTYVDEAVDRWMRSRLGEDYLETGFDIVVKRAELVWSGGARFAETLAVDVAARRWGTTSFDVGCAGSVDERPVFEAVLTYVSVAPGSTRPTPVPDQVRTALG